ncbi:MAG TPA: copper amine oxidase [Bacillales bacterium]|nr:copper amine oxidase [Bacillales bacterium]
MNWKKALIAVPLSAAILVPTAATELGNAGVANAASQPTSVTPAANLRATLGRLLSEHGTLAILAMRKGYEDPGSKDFQAAAAQLAQNTDDLAAAIGSVYGDKAAQAFKKMWSEHIGYFVEYVKGTVKHDKSMKQDALDNLSQYRQKFSQFISKATGGRVAADALAKGLQDHVWQLINAFNAYVDGDYAKAFKLQYQARQHLYMTAKGLSSAIVQQFPDKFNNTKAVTPASNLREKLALDFGGHVALAIEAMQNGIEGKDSAKVFQANAAALANDTDKLAADVASVYGDDAAQAFKKMWSNHIGYFVEYVKATAAGDKSKKQHALDELKQYREDFSQFISKATGGKIPADALSAALQKHVNQLITAFNDYVNKDYTGAYKEFDVAYNFIQKGSAKGLSNAIVQQFPDKFQMSMPSGMPKTDLGGTAGDEGETLAIILAAMAALTGAGAFMYRRKTAEEK